METLIHALKDITREDFNYKSTAIAFHEKRSGSGPSGEKKIQALVRGISSEHFEVSPLDPTKPEEKIFSHDGTLLPPYPSPYSKTSRIICREFGAYLDFWVLILVHKDIWIAMIFWLRHLWIVGNPVIVLSSAKMTQLFVFTNYLDLYQNNIQTESSVFTSFFNDCHSTDIDIGLVDKWKDLPIEDFILIWCGRIVVKQLFPGPQGFRIALIQLHCGITKYDPEIEPLLQLLRLLIALKSLLLAHELSISPVSNSESAMIDLRSRTERISKDIGLEDVIEFTRKDLGDKMKMTRSTRALAGMERRLEAAVEKKLGGVEVTPEKMVDIRAEVWKEMYPSERGNTLQANIRK